jgi:hypothetical protein
MSIQSYEALDQGFTAHTRYAEDQSSSVAPDIPVLSGTACAQRTHYHDRLRLGIFLKERSMTEGWSRAFVVSRWY